MEGVPQFACYEQILPLKNTPVKMTKNEEKETRIILVSRKLIRNISCFVR